MWSHRCFSPLLKHYRLAINAQPSLPPSQPSRVSSALVAFHKPTYPAWFGRELKFRMASRVGHISRSRTKNENQPCAIWCSRRGIYKGRWSCWSNQKLVRTFASNWKSHPGSAYRVPPAKRQQRGIVAVRMGKEEHFQVLKVKVIFALFCFLFICVFFS